MSGDDTQHEEVKSGPEEVLPNPVTRRPVKMGAPVVKMGGVVAQAGASLPPPMQDQLAAAPPAKRLEELIVTVRDRAEAAGLRPEDAMHALLESLVAMQSDVAMRMTDHSRRVEATTVACRHLMESGKAKAEADVQALSVQMVERLRQGLEADWSKMALRLPAQIGALRAVIVGVAGVVLLGAGLVGGAMWQRVQMQDAAAAIHATFAPGAKGTETWLRLHASNDIDAAIAAGRCSTQGGRRACDVSLWMENAQTPAHQ